MPTRNKGDLQAQRRRYIDKIRQERHPECGRMISHHPSCPHSTLRGYNAFGCRCEFCSDARSEYDQTRTSYED